jgi:hypothetical protein
MHVAVELEHSSMRTGMVVQIDMGSPQIRSSAVARRRSAAAAGPWGSAPQLQCLPSAFGPRLLDGTSDGGAMERTQLVCLRLRSTTAALPRSTCGRPESPSVRRCRPRRQRCFPLAADPTPRSHDRNHVNRSTSDGWSCHALRSTVAGLPRRGEYLLVPASEFVHRSGDEAGLRKMMDVRLTTRCYVPPEVKRKTSLG